MATLPLLLHRRAVHRVLLHRRSHLVLLLHLLLLHHLLRVTIPRRVSMNEVRLRNDRPLGWRVVSLSYMWLVVQSLILHTTPHTIIILVGTIAASNVHRAINRPSGLLVKYPAL